MGSTQLNLDTKGFCFLCLRERNDPLQGIIKIEPGSMDYDFIPSEMFSYQSLFRFLNMDKNKIFRLSAQVESLKNADVVVQVCPQCHTITQEFLDLYKQLESIRLNLNLIVHKIHDVMANAEEDQGVVECFQERMSCEDGEVYSKIIDNLRRETMEKCLNKIGTSAPQVSLVECRATRPKRKLPNKIGTSAPQVSLVECRATRPKRKLPRPPKTRKKPKISEERTPVDTQDWKCSHCSAKFKFVKHSLNRFRLNHHNYMYHCDHLFKEYMNPTINPYHFKVCCALLLQNCEISEKGYHCPYCPFVYPRKKKSRKADAFPHMMKHHKDEIILRLQNLQSMDPEELLQLHQDSGGKTCEDCGDVMSHINALSTHSNLYCLKKSTSRTVNVIVKTEVTEDESADSKRMKLDSETEMGARKSVKKIVIKQVSRPPAPVPRTVMKCSICGEEYFDPASLQKHKTTHTPTSIKDLKFPCPHCPQILKFYFTLRAHLMKSHPVEMFQQHLPPGTDGEEIKKVLKSLVESLSGNKDDEESENKVGSKIPCGLCTKEYNNFPEVESHILVTHFDVVVLRLKKLMMDEKKSE